jgi:hypothetical protein
VTQAVLTIVALSATLTASATSVTNGDSFTLTWSSSGATGCTTSGGGANGTPWTGPVGPSGTQTQTATTNGTFTYSLVCSGGNESTTPQQATIKVSALSSGTGASNSAVGGGGGGAMSALEVALLAALLALSRTVQPVVAAGRRRAA